MLTTINTFPLRLLVKHYYTNITPTCFCIGQPRVIFIHCLYLAKLRLVLSIGDIAQLVKRWNYDLEIAGSSPLYVFILQRSLLEISLYTRIGSHAVLLVKLTVGEFLDDTLNTNSMHINVK